VAWTDSTRNVLFDSSTNNYGNIQTFQPILNGTEEADELGIDGAAYILALGGDDKLTGDAYDDYFDGGNGADTLIGGAGHDTLMGGGDETDLRDVIYGGDGDDSIDGGYGNDELRGDAGADTITGGYGSDTVIGGDGDDVLTGQTWGDILFGGAGNDFVNGGFGHDRVNGGDGADQFYHIGNAGHGSDWIQDFNHAEGDSLIWGAGAATADDFLVQRAHTQNAGAANVDEVFITHKASGLLAWALVDGDAQTSLMVTAGGATFDLLT
jgi:Ca2+-binding RTX toxin-like protein